MTRRFDAELTLVPGPDAGEGIRVIAVHGELVATNCDELLQAVEAVIDGASSLTIVLDCRRLLHIDTPGLALLYRLQTRCRSIGGELVVAGLPERFSELVDALYVGEHVRFCDSIAAATRRPD